jgi:hypothetical protein
MVGASLSRRRQNAFPLSNASAPEPGPDMRCRALRDVAIARLQERQPATASAGYTQRAGRIARDATSVLLEPFDQKLDGNAGDIEIASHRRADRKSRTQPDSRGPLRFRADGMATALGEPSRRICRRRERAYRCASARSDSRRYPALALLHSPSFVLSAFRATTLATHSWHEIGERHTLLLESDS